MRIINSFEIENEVFYFYDINKLFINYPKLKKLPKVLKIFLEANLREASNDKEFDEIVNIFLNRKKELIRFTPSRVILKKFESISTLIELSSIRDILKSKNKEPNKINPKTMIDILINDFDEKDYEIYKEKILFIKWAEYAFKNIRVIPPNFLYNKNLDLNYLSTILHIEKKDEKFFLYPESILGIESNKNEINSFGVVALNIDKINVKSIILGNKISFEFPQVIGVKIHGELRANVLIENINDVLKDKLNIINLKGKILEFYGSGLKFLNIEHRKEILELCSTYGILCSFFVIDDQTITYLNRIKANENYGKLIKTYLKKQGLFYESNEQIDFDEKIDLDLEILENSIFQKETYNKENMNNNISLKNILKGNEFWQNLEFEKSDTYTWNENSTYIQSLNTSPNIFKLENLEEIDIKDAGILALFNDFVKAEDISPLGKISLYSPAAKYLESKGLKSYEYDTFLSRKANTNLMLRSIFDSSNIKNQMLKKEGSFTIDYRKGEIVSIYDKAQRFKEINRPLVIFAGKNYGIGDSREWASKGIRLLGVKAIIAKSFDENYRLSLIAFGVLPLQFIDDDIESLNLKGNESITIRAKEIKINSKVDVFIQKENINIEIKLKSRLDTQIDIEFYKCAGLYPHFLKSIED